MRKTLFSEIAAFLLIIMTITHTGCRKSPQETTASSKFPVVETTISNIHQSLQSGELTCRGLVQIYLDRIEKYDQATGLNAIVIVNPNALKRTEELDEEFKRTKKLSQHDQTAPQKDMSPGNSKMYFLENS